MCILGCKPMGYVRQKRLDILGKNCGIYWLKTIRYIGQNYEIYVVKPIGYIW